MDQTDMAPETYARWLADAALIVEAVNNYDRLKKIEAAARAMADFYEWESVPLAEHGVPEQHLIEALEGEF